MDKLIKSNTIKILTDLLLDHYVFPETAASIRNELTQSLTNNDYDEIADPILFAEQLNLQLYNISKDKHLNIRHNFKEVEEDAMKDHGNSHHDNFMTMLRMDNYGFSKVERLPGNIGLLEFQGFFAPELAGETASSAMTFLANSSGLIIDIRNNFGGSPHMVAFLSSYLLEPTPTHLNNLYWRKHDATHQFWSMSYVPGKRFGGLKPLYILTSQQAFSAAEEFAYNLQSIGRATIVGERTGGGANPGQMHTINGHFEIFIPNGRAINPVTKGNWEGVGVCPDIDVPKEQALDTAYIDLLEKELKRLNDQPTGGYERVLNEIKQTLAQKGVLV